MAPTVLILSAVAIGAAGQMFSTVRTEEATSIEIDENGNAKDVTQEDDVRPPMSELTMPTPSISSHLEAQIVIVSIFAGAYDTKKDVWRKVSANHEDYAEMHGYGYVQFDGLCSDRLDHFRLGDASWDALLAVRDVLKKVHPNAWIFWMDPDSSFANMTKKLEDFLPRYPRDVTSSLVITGDTNGFNAGHFLIRANEWSKQFLTDAWSVFSASAGHLAKHGMAAALGGADPEDTDTWEPAMNKLSGNWWHSETLDKVRHNLPSPMSSAVELVEFRRLASDSEVPDGEDFIVHAGGESMEKTEKVLREM